jgi:AcrR family transcriptional regulator
LLLAARAQFATAGFSSAELGLIARDAGVTTGAIYHHFGSKIGLFQAVAEQLEGEILMAAATARNPDPLARLREGFDMLIEICAKPDVQRIIFIEAAQVLGPEAWREIESRYALGALRGVLGTLIEQRAIKPYPADLLARVLLALLREVSADVARLRDNEHAMAQTRALVGSVFEGLFGR